MASCSPFHMKYPDFDAENLDKGIVFEGSRALVIRAHPIMELVDAALEHVGEKPLRAKPDADFMLVADQVRTLLAFLRENLISNCTC